MRELLAERQAVISRMRSDGATQYSIDMALHSDGLSYGTIAAKFEVSKSLVRFYGTWERRP